MDRGRAALFPILDELVAAKDKHKLLLCCGGGTRARHIYAIASELELPTGVLAALGGYVPRQNARMLQMLLAKHGGIYIMHDDFEKLPLYFQPRLHPDHDAACRRSATGRSPSEGGRIPAAPHRRGRVPHRRGRSARKRAIFIKDEDGLYDGRPEEEQGREAHPAHHGARSSSTRDLPDLVVERVVIEYLPRARFCTRAADRQRPRARA